MKGLLFAATAALFAIAPMAAKAEGQAFINVSGGPSHTSAHGLSDELGNASYYEHYGIDYNGSLDKKDAAYSITSGYRWMVDEVFSIGVEGGLVDLGKVSGHADLAYDSTYYDYTERERGSIHTRGALVGINAKWNLTWHWNLGLRGGYLHTWAHSKDAYDVNATYYYGGGNAYGGSSHGNTNGDGFYSAVKVGYDFTPFFGIGLGYEYYHTKYSGLFDSSKQNVGVIAASAEVRF